MTELAARVTRPIHRLRRASMVAIAVAFLVAVASSLLVARAYALRGSVLPGVEVAGIDVGGLSRDQARGRIAAELAALLHEPIEIGVGADSFVVAPAALFTVDPAATEARAYAAARESFGSRLAALAVPFAVRQEVEPVFVVTSQGRAALVGDLVALTERPVDARIRMEGRTPVVVAGRPGTTVDDEALVEALRLAVLAGVSSVDATVMAVEPPITTAEAEEAADTARTAVAGPVELAFRRERLGKLSPRELARLVRFERVGGTYEVALEGKVLGRELRPLVVELRRKPVDASFRVVGPRVRVVPAKNGRTLDAEATSEAVLRAATGRRVRVAEVELAKIGPDLTTREAKALGIRERVSTFTTDMGPSSPNRIWNVHLLGRYLDGTILGPGKRFSYNKVMGPRTAERGFREGQMIWNGVLVPAIGGGVCQTATTIFNAAFDAGLPIKERHNHSFYISHYPTGRDATVSWGGPDLVFKNDLDHPILIKVGYTDATFTVTFYGTKQRRKVISSTSTPTNHTQPKLQYAIDPSAPRGSVRTTGGGGPGFDVNVHRKVYERGKLIREDDFFTRYVPENPTAIYGAGSTPPGPYFYLPASA